MFRPALQPTVGWVLRSAPQLVLACFVALGPVVGIAVGLAVPSAWGGQAPARQNIVLIVAEDLSPRVGAFGDMLANTPAIDALAAQGVRYTRVFSAAGVCAPNRSAIITGVYPQSMGTHQMRTTTLNYLAVPPPQVKAFPELLRAAGYATANVAKTDYQFGEPFTIWDVNVGGFTDDPDLAVWRALPRDKPFFAMINLMSTHESHLATLRTEGAGAFAPMIRALATRRAKRVAAVTDPQQVEVPPYYPDTPQVRASIAQHYDNIHFMDGQTAQILQNLADDGLLQRTIVIWTTDHGDGLPRAKRSIYDSGLHIPMIIRYPDGAGAGTLDRRLISVLDLAPAVLGMAGVAAPGFVHGVDWHDDGAAPRRYVHAGRDRMDLVPDRVRAVRDRRYKYIRNYRPELAYFRPLTFRDMFPVMQALWQGHERGSLDRMQQFYFTAPRPVEELYDTLADPYEVTNLVQDQAHAGVLQRLRSEMERWLADVGDLRQHPEQDMIERMWPGGEQPVTAVPGFSRHESGVSLHCETVGASIGYRVVSEDGPGDWQLYTAPVVLPREGWLEAKAVRYGYAESAVVRIAD